MLKKAKIALDTNVLVSALLQSSSPPMKAFEIAVRQYEIVASPQGLDELYEVLSRPKFDAYQPASLRRRFFLLYCEKCYLFKTEARITLCRDPKDNHWLDLAVQAELDMLITGDADLLSLHPFQKTDIITPQHFVQL